MASAGHERAAPRRRCLALALALTFPLSLLPWMSLPARAQDGGDEGSLFGEEEAAPAATEQSAPMAANPIAAWVAVGGGLTQRQLSMEHVEGRHELDTAFVPAAALQLASRAILGAFQLTVELDYQTSLWTRAALAPPAGIGSQTDTRTHSFRGGLAPGVRFADGEQAVALSLWVGYGLRSLATVEHLPIPRFTLHGPILRLLLDLPVAGPVHVRIAPEAQLIFADPQLRLFGSLDSRGVALGGELSVAVDLVPWLALVLRYRESHVQLGSYFPTSMSDVSRFALLDLRARYY